MSKGLQKAAPDGGADGSTNGGPDGSTNGWLRRLMRWSAAKAGFCKSVVIGRGKGISSFYPNGDRTHCPGRRARTTTLKVIRDPRAKGHNAKVTEPSTCNYHVKVTSPHCHVGRQLREELIQALDVPPKTN